MPQHITLSFPTKQSAAEQYGTRKAVAKRLLKHYVDTMLRNEGTLADLQATFGPMVGDRYENPKWEDVAMIKGPDGVRRYLSANLAFNGSAWEGFVESAASLGYRIEECEIPRRIEEREISSGAVLGGREDVFGLFGIGGNKRGPHFYLDQNNHPTWLLVFMRDNGFVEDGGQTNFRNEYSADGSEIREKRYVDGSPVPRFTSEADRKEIKSQTRVVFKKLEGSRYEFAGIFQLNAEPLNPDWKEDKEAVYRRIATTLRLPLDWK